ncbi:metallophosphoesterase [Nocardioides sp. SOB77]|uniref:Metallophosphoesterase n=1 Tax=Nocardioides oceani TaxID=3058369 RepID=A0ABT8FJ76_9ACTN|nr:metallophosphoesterase [Nocardioides oceani]MDN4174595.1 metallophosphoesterase [Nocardioides oceani]
MPRRVLTTTVAVVVWAVLAVAVGLTLFLADARTVSLASHDAVVRPTLDGTVVVRTGPVLPDLRLDSGSRIGVDVRLGKTEATTLDELVQRYAYIGTQPEGPRVRVTGVVASMARDAAVRGGVIALVPLLVWAAVGRDRRRELLRRGRSWRGAVAVVLVAGLVVVLLEPWRSDDEPVDDARAWVPFAQWLGASVPLPEELAGLEVRGDVTTSQTKRLVESAVDTYMRSKQWYAAAAEDAAGLDVREPAEDETVALLVSDRHDNIGMDEVARAIGDAGGATAVLDAGDDTSTGKPWEAFSLDSVTAAFEDLDRYGVAGNHDHGSFVRDYLADRGWTMLDASDGEVVDGPGGAPLMGVDDPRSSGLGAWRDETELSFTDVGERLADVVCDADERVATVLVHDANLGREVLDRGCADLVVGGHLHVASGPEQVVGENGEVGHSFTTGTTGGAAYAIAIGSKIRRTASVTLITYRDERPVGLQEVDLLTNGVFEVGEYVELSYDAPAVAAAQ